MIILFYYCPR